MRKFLLFLLTANLTLILNAQPLKSSKWTLSSNSYGPVHVGMSLLEASESLGFSLTTRGETDEDEQEECRYVGSEKDLPGVDFMLVKGKVARIDVDSAATKTIAGAHVGMTESEIKKLYPGATVEPHPYSETGKNINVKDTSGKFGFIFETDGKTVISFRSGDFDTVQWPEGCE